MSKEQHIYIATVQGEGNGKSFMSAWIHSNSGSHQPQHGNRVFKNVKSADRDLIAEILSVSHALRQLPQKSHVVVHSDHEDVLSMLQTQSIVDLLRSARDTNNKPLSEAAHSFLDALAYHNNVRPEKCAPEHATLTAAYLEASQLSEGAAMRYKTHEDELQYARRKKAERPNRAALLKLVSSESDDPEYDDLGFAA